MSTQAIFETATLADSIKKADNIAPSRGAAFDQAAGIVIDIWPGPDSICTIKATNTDVFYTEWVTVESASGDPARWRLPSALMAGIVGGLPIGTGKKVTLTQEGNIVTLQSGRTRAKIVLIDATYYPDWQQFNSSLLQPVTGLGGRIKQVQWAAGKEGIFAGIHMDGRQLIATDRYKLVTVPCQANSIYKPITVPAGIISPLLKDESDTFIGISEDLLFIMPDEATQIKCVIYAGEYPKVERAMIRDHPASVKFNKNEFNSIVQRMLALVKGDRTPLLTVFFGNEEIALFMSDPQIGEIEDAIELPGQAIHDIHQVGFSPENLTKAITSGPNDIVTLHYDPSNSNAFLRIEGGSGYEAWVAPRLKRSED